MHGKMLSVILLIEVWIRCKLYRTAVGSRGRQLNSVNVKGPMPDCLGNCAASCETMMDVDS